MDKEDKSTYLPGLWIILGLLLTFLTKEILHTQSFLLALDSSVERFLFTIRTPFFLHIYDWVTLFGNTLFVMGLAGFISIFLYFSKKNHLYLVGLITTLVGAATTGYIMKILVARARPEGGILSPIESSFSFPSGHATASMTFYGFLVYMLCVLFPSKKSPIITTGIFLIGLIGFSRLYLGVHFPSDVLAGYLLGGLWLIIGISITKRIRSRSDIITHT